MRSRERFLGKAVLSLAAIASLGFIVMELWNRVATGAFIGARPIDYVHALGLLILSRILFGGFRGRPGGGRRRQWEKWQAMTPEEREEFRRGLHSGRHASTRE